MSTMSLHRRAPVALAREKVAGIDMAKVESLRQAGYSWQAIEDHFGMRGREEPRALVEAWRTFMRRTDVSCPCCGAEFDPRKRTVNRPLPSRAKPRKNHVPSDIGAAPPGGGGDAQRSVEGATSAKESVSA